MLAQSETAFSQTYIMSNSDITTCSGTYYDPGGNGNYSNSQSNTQTFYPGTAGMALQVSFSQFSTENNYDYLYIYSGNSTNSSNLIGKYSGNSSPGTIISSAADGSLTFKFVADNYVNDAGWKATFSCVTPPPPAITMSGADQYTCDATYYDPGGTGNYSNRTRLTQTIYPGTPGNVLQIAFSSFDVEDGGHDYDYLLIYNGNSTSAPLIGKYSGTTSPGTITSTAADGSLTFYFYSDNYTNYSGWQATISCIANSSITTGTINPLSNCPGSSVSVPFTSTGTFSSNTYTAQLSTASGSFSSPTSIGTLSSNANSGTISANIPAGTASGTGYRIRVISSNPSVTGSDNGSDITVNSTPPQPSTITGSTTVCSGSSQTYSVTNTGVTYTWNTPPGWTLTGGQGTNSVTYTVGSSAGTVQVTPSNDCGNGIVRTLAVSVNAPATITTGPASQAQCSGGPATFTVAATGNSLTYQWKKNGTNVGTSSPTYTTPALTTGDNGAQYTVLVTSAGCSAVSAGPATLTVNETPSVTTLNTKKICSGESTGISLTASTSSTFSWTVGTITGGITGASAGSGSNINQVLTNPSNSTAGTVQYIVTPTSVTGGCPGSSYTITVTVNPTPADYNSRPQKRFAAIHPQISPWQQAAQVPLVGLLARLQVELPELLQARGIA